MTARFIVVFVALLTNSGLPDDSNDILIVLVINAALYGTSSLYLKSGFTPPYKLRPLNMQPLGTPVKIIVLLKPARHRLSKCIGASSSATSRC